MRILKLIICVKSEKYLSTPVSVHFARKLRFLCSDKPGQVSSNSKEVSDIKIIIYTIAIQHLMLENNIRVLT